MARPSEYRAHYGAIAEGRLAEGASAAEAARALGVGVRTLRRWAAQHPAFGAALERGLAEGAARRARYRAECGAAAEARLAEGATAREVARALGVAHATLADWRAAHPDFAEAWARGTAEARRRGISTASRYRPQHCEVAAACLAKGYSLTVLADELSVCRKTLASWIAREPAFAAAVERGRLKGARLWEGRLEAAAAAGSVQAVIFALKRLDPERWGDGRAGEPAPPEAPRITRIETVLVEPKRLAGPASQEQESSY